MSTRKPTPPRRSLRPTAESLETRQLLSSLSTHVSASVSGTDTNGDKWTLTLYGPGTLNVVDQNGTAFTKDTQDITRRHQHDHRFRDGHLAEPAGGQGDLGPARIPTGASSSSSSRSTTRGPTGNSTRTWCCRELGRPRTASRRWTCPTSGWATPTRRTDAEFELPLGRRDLRSTPFKLAGGINAPEGINKLRFGGVDTTFTPNGGTPLNQTKQNNEFVVNLGPPVRRADQPHHGQGDHRRRFLHHVRHHDTVFQQSVTFVVNGRINLFQANEIDGNTTSGAASPPSSPARPRRRPACCRAALTSSPTSEGESRRDRSATSGSAATPRTSRPWRWRPTSSRSPADPRPAPR